MELIERKNCPVCSNIKFKILYSLSYKDKNPILRKYLFVPALFKVLRKEFKLHPMVCGSGSSCFVVVSEKDNLEMIKGFILESWGYETFMVETELI